MKKINKRGRPHKVKIERKRMGAPPKKTELVIAKLEEVVKLDMPINKAVIYAGITEPTYYNWYNKDRKFRDRMDGCRYFATKIARSSVISRMAKDGNLALAYLKAKEGDEFDPKNKPELPPETNLISDYTMKMILKYKKPKDGKNTV